MRIPLRRVKVTDQAGVTTWFGPYTERKANQVAEEFRRAGMKVELRR